MPGTILIKLPWVIQILNLVAPVFATSNRLLQNIHRKRLSIFDRKKVVSTDLIDGADSGSTFKKSYVFSYVFLCSFSKSQSQKSSAIWFQCWKHDLIRPWKPHVFINVKNLTLWLFTVICQMSNFTNILKKLDASILQVFVTYYLFINFPVIILVGANGHSIQTTKFNASLETTT